MNDRRGLPYGWWRRIHWEVIAVVICTTLICLVLPALIGAWVFDWKVWWQ